MSIANFYGNISELVNLVQTREVSFYQPLASEHPVVSIISSFFNAHQDFEDTYRCIINQTFQDFEWIIVDDCSTDPEAIELFQSLPDRSPKIRTFSHEYNKGLGAGRNTAIAHARGKYLYFIDLDDLLDPTCIEKCVLFLESHPEFSLVNSYSIGFQDEEYWWNRGFDKPARFFQKNQVTGRLLYRKADFEKLGGFDEEKSLNPYADWERWLKAISNSQKGWTIPEYLDFYRRTNSGMLAAFMSNIEEERRVTKVIKARYRDFFNNTPPQNIFISRYEFEISQLRFKFAVQNPLKRYKTGKRILFLLPFLEVGGSDKFNLDLVQLLNRRGYDITIVTTLKSEHHWYQYFYKITADIFHLPNFLHDAHWLAFTRYILESRQIDIVLISNCYIAYYFLPLLRTDFPEVAFIDYTHTGDPGWRGIGYPRVSCQFSDFLDSQVVSSNNLAKVYESFNFKTRFKWKTCYINVEPNYWKSDNQKRQQTRADLKISESTVVLLFPARIVEQKRPLFLVDIVKEVVALSLPLAVVVLGDGYLLPAMNAKINQLGLSSLFHILPPVEWEQMLNFYAAADILLLPSEYEGISLAIYEAMSMELPVVAADVGGQRELVTPETGFLVTKGKSDAVEVQNYVKVLGSLIQNPDLRRQVGAAARQRVVDLFPLEAMGDRMESIFREAMRERQNQPTSEINVQLAEETLLLALEYMQATAVENTPEATDTKRIILLLNRFKLAYRRGGITLILIKSIRIMRSLVAEMMLNLPRFN